MSFKKIIFLIFLIAITPMLLSQSFYFSKDYMTHTDPILNADKDKFKNAHVKSQTMWYVIDSAKKVYIPDTKKIFDEEGRIVEHDNFHDSRINVRVLYTYDKNSNLLNTITETRWPGDSLTRDIDSYQFDSLNRFTNIKHINNLNQTNSSTIYDYDDIENSFTRTDLRNDSINVVEISYFDSTNFLIRTVYKNGKSFQRVNTFQYSGDTLWEKCYEQDSIYFERTTIHNAKREEFFVRYYRQPNLVKLNEENYDEKGLRISTFRFNDSGKLSERTEYKYYGNGDVLTRDTFTADNVLESRYEYTYISPGLVSSLTLSGREFIPGVNIYTYEYYK